MRVEQLTWNQVLKAIQLRIAFTDRARLRVEILLL